MGAITGTRVERLAPGDVVLIDNDTWKVASPPRLVLGYYHVNLVQADAPDGMAEARCKLQLKRGTLLTTRSASVASKAVG